MDFSFSDEQLLLEQTVRRFVTKEYDFAHRQRILRSPEGWSRQCWTTLAELGVLALGVPEAQGGLGGGPIETLLVMNALGPALLLEPYCTSAVVATALMRDSAAHADLLGKMGAGECVVALAHLEPGAQALAACPHTRCREEGTNLVIDGHKCVVAHATAADYLIVSARHEDSIELLLVPNGTPGLQLDAYPVLDGTRAAEVCLRGVRVSQAARLRVGEDGLARALDLGVAAWCAEAVGIMKATLDATVEYLRTRVQFGQAIGRFQALQHRAVDMLIHYEQARSMSYLAALRCVSRDPATRRRALSAASVLIARAARFIGQQAVQLHGAIGMSDELIVSHWFKRLTTIELLLDGGGAALHTFMRTEANA